MRRYGPVIIIFSIVFLACASPFNSPSDHSPTPASIAAFILTPNPNATVTRTPFQPVAPTATNTTTPLPPEPSATITPSPAPTTETPDMDYGLPMPTGQVNILILGSDARPGGGFRTDVIILVAMNIETGNVSMVSFPRDLWVTIPGVGENRINVAMGYGGFDLMAATLETNFGIHPDHFVLTNFQGFIQLVDILGGITISASQPLEDHCDLPQSAGGYCWVEPGENWMDGETALWYVRSRYSSSDFDRTRRAQEVIIGLFNRIVNQQLLENAIDAYPILGANMSTDMSMQDVLSLIPLAPGIFQDPGRIRQFFIGPGQVYSYVIPSSGAQVLLPDYGAISEVLQNAMYP